MKFFKISFIFIICFLIGASSFAKEIGIDEFDISKIEIPDEYMVCTQKSCDEEFKSILAANGFGFTSWVNDVMKPNNYYIYAMNLKNECIYVTCQKNELQEIKTEKDGSKTHPLMSDYNMLQSADDKAELLTKTKDELVLQGVSADDITTLVWADFNEDTRTPYLEYACSINNQYIHSFETSYNASKICFQFTSSKPFSDSQKDMHSEIVKKANLGEKVDYTEAQNLTRENLQNKLAEETHSGENTKILRYVLSASIAFVVVFAIFMAIKSQSKKRRRSIIVSNEDETSENDNTADN